VTKDPFSFEGGHHLPLSINSPEEKDGRTTYQLRTLYFKDCVCLS